MLKPAIGIFTVGVALIALTGCAASTPLSTAGTATAGSYSSDGITELPSAKRGTPVSFSGTLDSGGQWASADHGGTPVVVNFWYAGCPPCRAEAPDLKAISEEYQPKGVSFVGVNVRDQASTALQFARRFSIPYPSILDADSGAVQLAFSGKIAPNAVPTTLVLDRKGRVAARVIGRIPDRSVLTSLIDRVLDEQP